jgi:PD-(D/E)XK endonuclease
VHWRRQGDLGELAAMEWFASKGALIYFPIGHSPECDFIAEFGDRLERVQVKTCTCWLRNRWSVTLCTRGGNQSWNGLVKRLDTSRVDCLFVVVGDGRRWCIPAQALQAGSHVSLGGPKYSEFEVEPGRPLPAREAHEPASTIVPLDRPGGCPSG